MPATKEEEKRRFSSCTTPDQLFKDKINGFKKATNVQHFSIHFQLISLAGIVIPASGKLFEVDILELS